MCFQSLIKSHLKAAEWWGGRTAALCFKDLAPSQGTMLKQLLQINTKGHNLNTGLTPASCFPTRCQPSHVSAHPPRPRWKKGGKLHGPLSSFSLYSPLFKDITT